MSFGRKERKNFLMALEFRYPEWIPFSVRFHYPLWKKYREKLEELVLRHPIVFPNYEKGEKDFDRVAPRLRAEYYKDDWGCLWHNAQGGMWGQVIESPLSDWKALDTYVPPDPLHKPGFWAYDTYETQNWEEITDKINELREKGFLTVGYGEDLFTRLYWLRGFNNLCVDMCTDNSNLPKLIDLLWDYEKKLIRKWLDIGVDVMHFHTDMATQQGLMISPAKFRQYLKPMFKDLFMTCRNAGTHVYLSGDGRMVDIVDDLIECGVELHDPQLGANTLEEIEKAYKRKMCAWVDINEQMFPFCKPEDIRNMIRETVERLYLPEGGLMIMCWVGGAEVPLENLEAMCKSVEEFCFGK